jgi:probable F420-dependent oxidoreductase
MASQRLALSVPLEGVALAELPDVAREAERLGYTDAWSYEADGIDCFSPLATIGAVSSLRLGTAIANVYTRGPATLAMSAAGLADVAPGRFCLGIGSGSQVIVEAWNGGAFERPATRVRETALFLRRALAGERVVFHGETFSVDGFRLSRPPSAPVPIHVAALRPGMLKVAGEVADGVIVNWLSAEDVPKSIAVAREAARAAGRDPAALEFSIRIMINIDPPSPESDLAVHRHITAYLNVPVYRAFQEWLGRGPALRPMWEAWERGDRRGAVAAVPLDVVRALILRGSVAGIRAGIQRYFDAGIDTAFLQLATTEPEPARRRQRVLDAVRALAPSAR